ncbi:MULTISPECIES: low specificity L-threonine aldolase [unclassified Janthinobacterium]|uniref:threonine aldolase family protein n=1 Tax=unclassified Janthinobacterium TaxID=2610881 RepID=UPI00160C9C0C|nr:MULTISPECIES: beta-eliminating lyase-related protein [unclassified Janthinobacterium]MBB5368512.1 threonine aldolase [Janthinobacterium sp. K2C7]MBB5381952.1 threonine aldolase [Janthinobacterium sp. K2Li3]MBB5386894.1 threonine aldolase [Janthinobacterium sp. K2E3]
MTETELRLQCHTVLPGHRQPTPAGTFTAMAAWCADNNIAHDIYGEGALIGQFEQKIASLLGYEAAVFCVTGTIAQSVAMRLACQDRGSSLVALHPTAHVLRHERSNHELFGTFQGLSIGDPHRPWTVDDLRAVPDVLGAVQLELPMREIGGQTPSWEELEAIKRHCKANNIHLHMDGARLWETQAAFGQSLSAICSGFDSTYVSLYKGLGGMGGAVLAGSRSFIERARAWLHRQGGNTYHRTPYVVAAAMQFDARLAAMPQYFERTLWLYQTLRDYPAIAVNPAKPQANMLHLHLPVSRDKAIAIRNQVAREHGIWLFGRASHAALPGHSYVEWYVGDNLLGMEDQQVRKALALLVQGF